MIRGSFAPPTVDAVSWLAAARDAGSLARLAVDPGPGDHGIPLDMRRRWLEALFPGIEIVEGGEGDPIPPSALRVTEAQLRDDPFTHWDHLPGPVRPDYLARVAIVGPESVGKSTLARRLAIHLGGRDVQEFARDAFPWGDPEYRSEPEHMVEICRGHSQWIAEAERVADRWLFSDTEALTTLAWSELYFGAVPDGVVRAADQQDFDLFLLLDFDVEWVADGTRTWKDHREPLYLRLKELLQERHLPFREVSGTWDTRFHAALHYLEEMGPPRAPRGVAGRYPHLSDEEEHA